MTKAYFRYAFLTALALAYVPAADAANKPQQTETVDGFVVNLLAFPTTAHLHRPTSKTGNVEIGANTDGYSPYTGTPLAGSPYIAVGDGSATWLMSAPVGSIAFIWGTPDPYNTLALYDVNGDPIGQINGGDLAQAFDGNTDGYYQIVSPTPIGSVVASSTDCCFEIGNERTMPAPK